MDIIHKYKESIEPKKEKKRTKIYKIKDVFKTEKNKNKIIAKIKK